MPTASIQKGSKWFTTWFDTPLYEKLYADRDQQEAVDMIDLLGKLLPTKGYSKVLDLGCGRGRHSIEFARRGYDVTGLDLSERALEIARQKTKKEGLQVEFIQGDMRVPIQTEGQTQIFDLVLNLFTTFGYFDDSADDERVVDAIAEMVRPQGWFVLDFMNPEWVRKTILPYESRSMDGVTVQIRRWIESGSEVTGEYDIVKKEITFRDDHGQESGIFRESVRLYPIEWFKNQLNRRGFQLISLFGNYQGDDFWATDSQEHDSSPRAIQFFQKIN